MGLTLSSSDWSISILFNTDNHRLQRSQYSAQKLAFDEFKTIPVSAWLPFTNVNETRYNVFRYFVKHTQPTRRISTLFRILQHFQHITTCGWIRGRSNAKQIERLSAAQKRPHCCSCDRCLIIFFWAANSAEEVTLPVNRRADGCHRCSGKDRRTLWKSLLD